MERPALGGTPGRHHSMGKLRFPCCRSRQNLTGVTVGFLDQDADIDHDVDSSDVDAFVALPENGTDSTDTGFLLRYEVRVGRYAESLLPDIVNGTVVPREDREEDVVEPDSPEARFCTCGSMTHHQMRTELNNVLLVDEKAFDEIDILKARTFRGNIGILRGCTLSS